MSNEAGIKSVEEQVLNSWAGDLRGPVAIHLRQKLLPVEGEDGVIFPPTYAMGDERKFGPYAIDQLSDGTKVAQIDSVGSQANRMEPLFRRASQGEPDNPFAELVPQIEILVGDRAVSLFDVGHRIGDALVRASGFKDDVQKAFSEFQKYGDATAIAKIAPTSLVFGAWDSRGEQAKVPRIVQSVIRAWDVDLLRRSAQYNPPVDYSALDVFSEEEKQKAEGDKKSPVAQRGFVHVPAVDTPGGIVVRGGIFRDVTLNLVALRQLDGKPNGLALRRYILGLALIAATDQQDGFLRQGCLLTRDPGSAAWWTLVHRSGAREQLEIEDGTVLAYARVAAKEFGVGPNRQAPFSKEAANADLPDKKEKSVKKPKA
jgi:CRISPR-associated protein Csb1